MAMNRAESKLNNTSDCERQHGWSFVAETPAQHVGYSCFGPLNITHF